MTRSERIYRALLRAYPRGTRDVSGDDMAQLFTDRLRDAGSTREVASVWVESVADLLKTAPRERLVARRTRQLVDGPALEPERVPMKRDAALASIPLVITLLVAAWRPAVLGAMLANPPGFLGFGLGIGILLLFAVLASVGILAARRNRELNDPWHQAMAMLVLLWFTPFVFLTSGLQVSIAYAWIVTAGVFLGGFRRLMLALIVPFVVWLIIGPVVMGYVVELLNGMAGSGV